jgi:hypothetical protein
MKNSENIKILFNRFKQSKHYEDRIQQSSFSVIAKNIIIETLNSGDLTNEKLTSFIQMFKANCSLSNFKKNLFVLKLDIDFTKQTLKQFKELEKKGFTLAGRFKISTLNSSQLSSVKNFLISSNKMTNTNEAKELVTSFERLDIPEVKMGIFSPWLHYINPNLFPISNTTTKRIQKYIDYNVNNYSDSISFFEELKIVLGEENLSILDYFCWFFDKDFVDNETLSTKIFAMCLSDEKLSIITDAIVNKAQKYSKIIKEEYNFRNNIEEIEEVDYKRYWLLGAFTSLGKGKQEDKSDWMISNGVWVNGWKDRFTKDIKSVRVGDEVAIKAVFARGDKSLMKIKCKGVVTENPKDGKNLYVDWQKDFKQYEVDFTGGYWSTVSVVENEEHIKKIFEN